MLEERRFDRPRPVLVEGRWSGLASGLSAVRRHPRLDGRGDLDCRARLGTGPLRHDGPAAASATGGRVGGPDQQHGGTTGRAIEIVAGRLGRGTPSSCRVTPPDRTVSVRNIGAHHPRVIYKATAAYPYVDTERATLGLRGQLRMVAGRGRRRA